MSENTVPVTCQDGRRKRYTQAQIDALQYRCMIYKCDQCEKWHLESTCNWDDVTQALRRH